MWQQCVRCKTGAALLGHFLPNEAEKKKLKMQATRWAEMLISDQRAALFVPQSDQGEAV